jgi:hypothetical protein
MWQFCDTVQYYAMPHGVILYSTASYCTLRCSTALYSSIRASVKIFDGRDSQRAVTASHLDVQIFMVSYCSLQL